MGFDSQGPNVFISMRQEGSIANDTIFPTSITLQASILPVLLQPNSMQSIGAEKTITLMGRNWKPGDATDCIRRNEIIFNFPGHK